LGSRASAKESGEEFSERPGCRLMTFRDVHARESRITLVPSAVGGLRPHGEHVMAKTDRTDMSLIVAALRSRRAR